MKKTYEEMIMDAMRTDGDEGLKFTTYPHAGVVKAKLTGVDNNVMVAITKLLRNHSKYLVCPHTEDLMISGQFSGKARANFSMGGVFDEPTGSGLARERCMKKYHKNFDARMRMFLRDVRTVVAAVEHYCDSVGIQYDTIESVADIRAKRFGNT